MKDLSLHILDIIQNSLRAGANQIETVIHIDPDTDCYYVVIKDNGIGMDSFMSEKVTDPFFTTRSTRKIGLGIPLLKQNTERTGGIFRIESKQGEGTTVISKSVLSHIDMLPEGDIGGVMALLISANPAVHFIFRYKVVQEEFNLDTNDVKDILGEVPVTDPEVRNFLKEMISENLLTLKAENKYA